MTLRAANGRFHTEGKPKTRAEREADQRQKLSTALAAFGFHGKNAKKDFVKYAFEANADDLQAIRKIIEKV